LPRDGPRGQVCPPASPAQAAALPAGPTGRPSGPQAGPEGTIVIEFAKKFRDSPPRQEMKA